LLEEKIELKHIYCPSLELRHFGQLFSVWRIS